MFDQVGIKDEPSDWKAFKFDDFENNNFEAEVLSKNNNAVLDDNFKILYEKNHQSNASDAFIRAYKKEEKNDNYSEDKPDLTEPPLQEPVEPPLQEPKGEKVPDTKEIERMAYNKGYSEGEKEGYDAGQEKSREIINRMQAISQEIEGLWKNMIIRYEKEIIQLISRVAEKVVYGQVAVENEIVKKSILHAFKLMPEPVDATINVSAEDYEYIESMRSEIFEQIKHLKHVAIISDPSMQPGGCHIVTQAGEVDASLESRLNAIRKSVIEVSENRCL